MLSTLPIYRSVGADRQNNDYRLFRLYSQSASEQYLEQSRLYMCGLKEGTGK